jgi:hypothetical protein
MSGVLALALKRKALSHGTVPSAVRPGQALSSGTVGTLGTRGTLRTLGTLSDSSLDGEPWDPAVIEERAALAAERVPDCYLAAFLCDRRGMAASRRRCGPLPRCMGRGRGDDAMDARRIVRRAAQWTTGRARVAAKGRTR